MKASVRTRLMPERRSARLSGGTIEGSPDRYVSRSRASGTVSRIFSAVSALGAGPGPADRQVLGHLRRDHDDPASGGHQFVTVGEVVDRGELVDDHDVALVAVGDALAAGRRTA